MSINVGHAIFGYNFRAGERKYKNILDSLVKVIPSIYYTNVNKPIIVDKCRSWTLPANMEMLNRYFNNPPKVIVLIRPIVEIVASFMSLRKENGWQDLETGLLDDGSEPIMRSLAGVEWARKNNNGEFIFVTYDELVDDTTATLERIYEHCGWEPFTHNLTNIIDYFKENDLKYNAINIHDVRPQIKRRKIDIKMSDELIKKCNFLNEFTKETV